MYVFVKRVKEKTGGRYCHLSVPIFFGDILMFPKKRYIIEIDRGLYLDGYASLIAVGAATPAALSFVE